MAPILVADGEASVSYWREHSPLHFRYIPIVLVLVALLVQQGWDDVLVRVLPLRVIVVQYAGCLKCWGVWRVLRMRRSGRCSFEKRGTGRRTRFVTRRGRGGQQLPWIAAPLEWIIKARNKSMLCTRRPPGVFATIVTSSLLILSIGSE